MEALKLASVFADCCGKCYKKILCLRTPPPKMFYITRGKHLDTYPPGTNYSEYFSFSFLLLSRQHDHFLASPPNNVLTARMSQGHIKIQILSSSWIKHCNVWTVFSIDVLMSWFCLMVMVKVRQALTPPIYD